MKIAVIFLCLSISCFIDTSTGNGVGTKKFDKCQAQGILNLVYLIIQQLQNLKNCTCTDMEKEALGKALLNEIYILLKLLSVTLGITLQQVLDILGFPAACHNLFTAQDFDALLVLVVLDDIVRDLVLFAEALLASLGIVLSKVLASLTGVLGGVDCKCPYLHTSIPDICNALTNSPIGNLLVSLGLFQAVAGVVALLSGVLGGGGGLLGGLLGL